MPDLVQHRRTGRRFSARELTASAGRIRGLRKCPDCDVAMTPVACNGATSRVAPHYRANGHHAAGCRHDGLHPDASPDETRRTRAAIGSSAPVPGRLRLARVRVQRRDPDTSVPGAIQIRTYLRLRNTDAPPATHPSTASMLHGIAEIYWECPSERWRRLNIPGCPGQTYGECFRPPKIATGHVRHELSVLFAPIRFLRSAIRGRTIIMGLVPTLWLSPRVGNRRPPPDAVYRVVPHRAVV